MLEDNKSKISYIGWCLFIFTIVSNLGAWLFMWIIKNFAAGFTDSKFYYVTLIILPLYFVAFPILVAMLKKVPKKKMERKRTYSKYEIFKLFCICISVVLVLNSASVLFIYLLGLIKGTAISNPINTLFSDGNSNVILVYTILIAPILEEVTYRKILMERMQPYGRRTAIIVTAVSFAVMHGNLSQFFYALVLGLIFGYLADATGGIKITVFLHIMINFIGTGSIIFVNLINSSTVETVYSVVILFIIIFGIIFFFKSRKDLFRGFLNKEYEEFDREIGENGECEEDGTAYYCTGNGNYMSAIEAYKTPGMIFYLILGVAVIVASIVI